MDFALSESQQHWYDAARRFAREELVDTDRTRPGKDVASSGARATSAARGSAFLGLPVPAEYGGQGQDLATTVAALEGLGYGCPDTGLIFGIGASLWTVTMPILAFGTEAQKKSLPARPLRRPAARCQRGQRARSRFRYLQHGDASRSGRRWLGLERAQDLDHQRRRSPTSSFALPAPIPPRVRSASRRSSSNARPLDSRWSVTSRTWACERPPWPSWSLRTAMLSAESILGREGRGSTIFNAALEWERGAILAGIVGTMRRQLDRLRETGAVPEAVRSTDRQVSVGLESDRRHDRPAGNQPVHGLSLRLGQDRRARTPRSGHRWPSFMFRRALSRTASMRCASSAPRVMCQASGQERDLRDSVGGVIFSGTNDIQRNLIAQSTSAGLSSCRPSDGLFWQR